MTKKIMFNDKFCLTFSVLAGQKTMTRRVEKPTEMADGYTIENVVTIFHEYSSLLNAHSFSLCDNEKKIGVLNPRYQVGEVVAIAQSYNDIGKPQYDEFGREIAGNTNKMFVKADLMPHHIKITSVKVERLQDISKEDCLKEGIIFIESLSIIGDDAYFFAVKRKVRQMYDNILKFFSSPQRAYADLIDKISGRGTWKRNPWVVAYSFELLIKNENISTI